MYSADSSLRADVVCDQLSAGCGSAGHRRMPVRQQPSFCHCLRVLCLRSLPFPEQTVLLISVNKSRSSSSCVCVSIATLQVSIETISAILPWFFSLYLSVHHCRIISSTSGVLNLFHPRVTMLVLWGQVGQERSVGLGGGMEYRPTKRGGWEAYPWNILKN